MQIRLPRSISEIENPESRPKMTRGRTPTPHSLQLLTGRHPGRDSGGRPLKSPPLFKRLPPEPPDWLSPVALAEWHRVLPELTRLDLCKELDAVALSAYCECCSLFAAASSAVSADGVTVVQRFANGSTRSVPHPAVAIMLKAGAQVRSWAAEFGLTPAAEMRIAKPMVPVRDGFGPFDADGILD